MLLKIYQALIATTTTLTTILLFTATAAQANTESVLETIPQAVNSTANNAPVSNELEGNDVDSVATEVSLLATVERSKTSLKQAVSVTTNLEEKALTETDSIQTDFAQTNLKQPDLAQTDLAQTNFAQTELAQADLSQTNPAQMNLEQAVDNTFAQRNESDIREQLRIDPNTPVEPVPEDTLSILDRPQAVPSSTFLTPTAYGADWGNAYVGVSGATVSGDRDVDGSISAGIGFGDAVDNVGVEVGVGIISLDGFADDGIVGLKVHKLFPEANNLAVAVGWANPIKWGAANDAEDTFYGVVTRRFDLQPNRDNTLPLIASVGVGTGTFRSTGAIAADDNAPNVFGSVGLRVIPEVSLISSWTGSALGLGASVAPFDLPIVFTGGLSDVTDNTAEGLQFNASIGYSFSF